MFVLEQDLYDIMVPHVVGQGMPPALALLQQFFVPNHVCSQLTSSFDEQE
jgi:hypothetical protein